MKTLFASALSILAISSALSVMTVTTAQASENTVVAAPEKCILNAADVATVLTASIDELTTLAKEHVGTASRVTCETKAPGVSEYKFFYYTCGMCWPQREGVLTVEQDLRPTYADGAPIYKKNLVIANRAP